ncbi:MAG: helicase HerA domain-containing protein [Acidimicrobiales bacterium]
MTTDAWSGFQFHQLTRVPREAESGSGSGSGDRAAEVRRALFAALTGSHADLLATGDPAPTLVTAWLRSPGDPTLRLVVGGRPFFPPAGSETGAAVVAKERPVLFPPGAGARDLEDRVLPGILDQLPSWVPCSASSEALWAASDTQMPAVPRRGSFDSQAAHLGQPFGWLVVAQPMLPDEVRPEIDALVNEILPLTRSDISEAKRISLERKQVRHRELARSQADGCWRIRVLIGGRSPRDATTVAALLCAASELDGLPYVLGPAGEAAPLTEGLAGGWRDGPDNNRSPSSFTASTELLVALTRPPARELPGVRLVQRATFDVTPEVPTATGMRLGDVLDEAEAAVGGLSLTPAALNRHTFVCGATGSGKSQTVRHLLEQATRAGIHWLVVEPAKAEYSRMAERLADLDTDVLVLRPNDPDAPPAGINPLEPAPGFPLQTHVDLLRALFLAAFEPVEPFPQVLAAALKRCYEELGWDLTLGEPTQPGRRPRYPRLGDLERVAETIVEEIGYGREIADNVRGFIKVRLASLRLGTTGRFFEGGHPIDFGRLHGRNVVLEIEDIGDDADKAFFMGAILTRLVEHLRVANRARPADAGPPPLSHLTVVEEAHRLLRRPDRSDGVVAQAVEQFAAMLAEVRAYGEGLIVAEQIPSKLIPDVIKNTAVKIVHRLPALDDRDSVGATMNIDVDQSRYLVTLAPGQGAVFADGMDRPVLVRVPEETIAESSSTGRLAAVTDLVGRRSGTCGADCQTDPCTLRQICAAQQLAAVESWITAWAELAVLAHLTGDPLPVPDDSIRATLATQGLASRTADCAISHAVDDAVAVRSASFQPGNDPAVLADHVCTAIRRVLAGESHGCRGDALRFLARPFRWELVRNALADDGAGPGRHPDTAEWEALYRRRIPGETRVEQLTAVKTWLKDDWDDVAGREAAVYGTRRPSTLESLVGPADDSRRRRLETVLDQFAECTWPLVHLVPEAPLSGGDSDAGGQ